MLLLKIKQNFMVNFWNSMAQVLWRSLKPRTTQQKITRRIVLKLYRFKKGQERRKGGKKFFLLVLFD